MIMKQLMPDGTPDSSFGQENGGLVFGHHSGASSVALRADGRFVVGGFRQLSSTGPADDGILIGMTADGRRDPTFAGGKTITIPSAGRKSSYLLDVDVLPNGRILAVGATQNRVLVIKVRGNGTYDRSFGTGGRAIVDPGGKRCRCSIGRAMDQDKKGRVIVTGYVSSADLDGAGYGITMRFGKDGVLDRSFGSGGVARLYATPRASRYATSLVDTAVDSKGGIWVTGNAGSLSGKNRKAVIVRYLPSSKRDRRFRRGRMTIGLGEVTTGWEVFRAGRKIYLSGRYSRGGSDSFYLKRFKLRFR